MLLLLKPTQKTSVIPNENPDEIGIVAFPNTQIIIIE